MPRWCPTQLYTADVTTAPRKHTLQKAPHLWKGRPALRSSLSQGPSLQEEETTKEAFRDKGTEHPGPGGVTGWFRAGETSKWDL